MNELKVFENSEFGAVRTVEVEGKTYFVASDVAKALGYSIPHKAVQTHCKGVLKWNILTNGGSQEMLIIPEGDIYRLVVKSQLPSAERFESWIFDEVLPTIRKHGVYAVDELLNDPELAIKAFTALKEERQKNKMLQAENDIMKPKALFADAVSASESSILMRDLAKLIRQNGVEIGEKRLYKWMREHGYVCKGSTMPTQKAMELGLFEIIVRTVERGDALPLETKTAKVTGKGQIYFVQKFLVG